ncbi:MAG: phospho-N-acetylmuramoyl-pentapeptide-transferase [Anaerovoracaceae bacterium]|jgi:phospho-N-acetylmuramoyl-pentapeptide-transferase
MVIDILIVAVAALLAAVFTKIEIPILKKKQFGQYIRELGPESHKSKEGTPTMGGVAIYLAIIIASLIFSRSTDMIVMIVSGAAFALIGFIDDYTKVAKKNNLGLRAWQKLLLQIIFSVLLSVYAIKMGEGTDVWIPFINREVDFGIWFIPFVVFVMVAMTNSVNLTDGLDGLCSGVTAIVSVFFAIAAAYFGYRDSEIFCLVLTGACLGFLVFNRNPAKIFMGDTGSLALGGALTAAAVLCKAELLIPFAGFVYVMESASVIIQVISFQTTGKRVFRMSPIHHHFELGGMSERKVVAMFWVMAAVFCLIAYGIMMIGA